MTDPVLIASIPAVGALLGILLQRDHRVIAGKLDKQDGALEEVHLLVNSRLDGLIAEIKDLRSQLVDEQATIKRLEATWDGIDRRKKPRHGG